MTKKEEKKIKNTTTNEAVEELKNDGNTTSKNSQKDQQQNEQLTSNNLQEKINSLEKELSETKDKLLRAFADFDNYKKRSYKEMDEIKKMVKIDTLIPFLKVYDHFELAVKAANEKHSFEVLYHGMELILSEFTKAFDELGIEKIDAIGKKFDPHLHEASLRKTSEKVPEGYILEQWRCGYKIGDKVLQPALVVVSSGTDKTIAEDDNTTADKNQSLETEQSNNTNQA